MLTFISWHYTQGVRNFFQIWRNYLEFFWHYFSVGRFFSTLFSSWRRDVSRVGERGLHPILFLQTLAENIVTRILGAIVKSLVILMGLAFEILTIILGFFLFLVWMAVPLVFVSSLGEVVFSLTREFDPLILFWLITFFASLAATVVSLFSYKNRGKDYSSMDLPVLSQERWFERVWSRLGKKGEEVDKNILSDKKALEEFLRSLDMTPEEFSLIVEWEITSQTEKENKRRFWTRENLMSAMPIGRHWSYAYTVKLDKYAQDLSLADYTEYKDARLIGKENDLLELKRVLMRPSQNNVILVGDPGVGRDTIIHTLAREIRNNELEAALANKRILEIDLKEVLADYAASGEEDRILELLFSEAAYAGNIILVIRNLHEYVDPSGAAGHDISSILSQYMGLPTFEIIGTTSSAEFHSIIEKKGNLMKYCESIVISEMGQEDTLKVLRHKLEAIERERVIFTYPAMRELVKLADRYITNAPFPEKALDLMEEVILHWNNSYSEFVTVEVVNEAVSAKIKVPLGEVESDESEKLLNLEDHLHERVIGQEFAIRQIAETMRRARIGMADKNKPVGSFLFLGPTGVGKTESAKALSEAYFGGEERMIRLDMSEYQTQESIDRLIGSSSGQKEGHLANLVRENPYSLLLLDEIEKAYPDILNLFLQVLDEGHLTDAFGKKVSFRNLIIIATSNVGAEIIKEGIENSLEAKDIQSKVIDYAIREGIFRPEFLNRFEGVVFFHSLSPEDTLAVTGLLLEKYALRLREQENIEITFGAGVSEKIVAQAYDPVFGARSIDRYIQDKIGDAVVKLIISKELKKGAGFVFESGMLG